MSHSDVAHNFAHYTGNKKNGHNVFYEEHENGSATIYSYGKHFGIAHRLPKDTHGLNVCLFTLASYSVSTAKHVHIVGSALSHYEKIYVPQSVDRYMNFNGEIENGYYQIDKDLNYFEAELMEAVKKHINARKYSYESEIIETVRNAEKYVEFFSCKNRLAGKLREILHGKESLTDTEILNACLSQSEIDKIKEREAEKREAEKRKKADQLQAFRNGEIHSLHGHSYTYLRVTDSGDIQTSKGIKIDQSEAKQLFKLCEIAKKKKRSIKPDLKIQHYRIDEIATDGTIKAGCHTVRYSEAQKIAKKLNWA